MSNVRFMIHYIFKDKVERDITIGKLVCLARSYKKHAQEMNSDIPKEPIFFLKPASSVIFNGGTIKIPKMSKCIHHEVELGIVIGEKEFWGKGYATEAIKLMASYAFDTLNLHKITAGCYVSNEGSKRAFQKAGFEVEGIRKSHCFCHGSYIDTVLLGLLREGFLRK